MAAKPKRRTKPRPGAGGSTRRKTCYFCKDKVEEIDYKNYNQLRRYVSEKGKIRSRRITGRLPPAPAPGGRGGQAGTRGRAAPVRRQLT